MMQDDPQDRYDCRFEAKKADSKKLKNAFGQVSDTYDNSGWGAQGDIL